LRLLFSTRPRSLLAPKGQRNIAHGVSRGKRSVQNTLPATKKSSVED
jgi:hypothetical protein